jgi:hypothetical protein
MESKNKYSNWVMTVFNEPKKDLPNTEKVVEGLETISDKFIFQKEICPSTGREHYQGSFVTRIRKRHRTVLNELSVFFEVNAKYITLSRMQGTWEQNVEYCSKDDSRVNGSEIIRSKSLEEEEMNKYAANDLSVFKEEGFFSWQASVNDIIFETDTFNIKSASSREVYWIEDLYGNTGKSLYTKYLCYNNPSITKLAFGSGSQMRSAVVEEGARKCYIIDIPRKLCNDDFQNNIYSVIEDLKNGFVKTSMYGKPKTLFMEPPIIIIFSNNECPTEKLSLDRWKIFTIINKKLVDLKDERL